MTGASPDPMRRTGTVTASSADACRLPPEPPRVQPGIGTRHLASAHRIVPAHASRPLILRPCSGGAGMVLLIRVDHRAYRARLTAAVRPVACIGADGSTCGSFCRPPGMRHAPSPTAPPTGHASCTLPDSTAHRACVMHPPRQHRPPPVFPCAILQILRRPYLFLGCASCLYPRWAFAGLPAGLAARFLGDTQTSTGGMSKRYRR